MNKTAAVYARRWIQIVRQDQNANISCIMF